MRKCCFGFFFMFWKFHRAGESGVWRSSQISVWSASRHICGPTNKYTWKLMILIFLNFSRLHFHWAIAVRKTAEQKLRIRSTFSILRHATITQSMEEERKVQLQTWWWLATAFSWIKLSNLCDKSSFLICLFSPPTNLIIRQSAVCVSLPELHSAWN